MASVAKTSGIQIEFDLKGHPRNRNFRFSMDGSFLYKILM